MLKVKVYNQTGKPVGEVSLEPKIFGIGLKPELVQQAVRTLQANQRVAIAHTKGRAEVSGGGKKPWRQKGTGRARHGSIRSPLWKGGGVTFGPRNTRNFSLVMNQKAKKKALFMTLSDKAKEKNIVVLDKLDLKTAKTKDMANVIKSLPVKKTTLIIIPSKNQTISRASRNIPTVQIICANSLNVVNILDNETLLIMKPSLAVIKATYLGN